MLPVGVAEHWLVLAQQGEVVGRLLAHGEVDFLAVLGVVPRNASCVAQIQVEDGGKVITRSIVRGSPLK